MKQELNDVTVSTNLSMDIQLGCRKQKEQMGGESAASMAVYGVIFQLFSQLLVFKDAESVI